MKVHGALQFAVLTFLVVCTSNGYMYEESLAVAFLNAAAGAYPENQTLTEVCLNKAFNSDWNSTTNYAGFQVVAWSETQCSNNAKDICKSYLARSDKHKRFVIGIRGTEGLSQFWDETTSAITKGVNGNTVTSNPDAHVVGYFLTAMNYVYKNMNIEGNLLDYQDYEVYVTGHSLGGALAALVAKRIIYESIRTGDQVKLITFGEPRVGNYAFAQELATDVPYTFRVVHGDDPIPHVPPCGDGMSQWFKKTCNHGGWYHHATEVWYKALHKRMDQGLQYYDVCSPTDGEDPNCSDGVGAFTRFVHDITSHGIDMHLNYFNHMISSYGKHGCVDVAGASTASMSVLLFLFAVVLGFTRN